MLTHEVYIRMQERPTRYQVPGTSTKYSTSTNVSDSSSTTSSSSGS